MFQCIIDDEIELRLIERQFAPLITACIARNTEHLHPHMHWLDEHYCEADAEMFIALVRSYFAEEKTIPLTIWVKGEFIGMIDAKEINRHDKTAEIGYWLDGKSQGRGIITRSVIRLLTYLFDNQRLNRVIIRCETGNTRSRAVPERLGFTLDGIMRQETSLHGRFADMAVYSLLNKEWQATKETLQKTFR